MANIYYKNLLLTNFNTTKNNKKYIPDFNKFSLLTIPRTITIVNEYNQPIQGVTYSENSNDSTFKSNPDGEIIGNFKLNNVDGILTFPNSDTIGFNTSSDSGFGIATMRIEYSNSSVDNVPPGNQYISGYAIKNNLFERRALYKDGLNSNDSFQKVSLLYGYYTKNYMLDTSGYSTIIFQYDSNPSSTVNFKVKKRKKNSQTSINVVLTGGDPPFMPKK